MSKMDIPADSHSIPAIMIDLNNSDDLLPVLLRKCTHCPQSKHPREFLPKTRILLQEIEAQRYSHPDVKLLAECHQCREKRRPRDPKRNEARRKNADESRLAVDVYSWDHIVTMIEEAYINPGL
jgi:hypothetical protein